MIGQVELSDINNHSHIPKRMRILFNVWCRAGHLNTSLSLAEHLVRVGDKVKFFCADYPSYMQERLRRVGLDIDCVGPELTMNMGQSGQVADRLWLTRKLQDPRWRLIHWEGWFVRAAALQVRPLRKAITAFRPDLVCTDGMSYGGAIAAELEAVPWVTFANTWDLVAPADYCGCPLRQTLEALDPVRKQMSASFGVDLTYRWNQVVSPYLNLTFCIEQLLPRDSVRVQTELVGHYRMDIRGDECGFPWTTLDAARPLVYISNGTVFQFEPDVVRDLAEAALGEGAQVVLSGCPDSNDLGKRAVLVDYAPQPQLLRRAALFVTHGGDNSVMEGLMAGVPLLVVPLAATQPVTAACVAQAGCARVIDPWESEHGHYRTVVRELLSVTAPERPRTKEIQMILEGLDAGRRGAELLHQIVS